MSSVNRPCRILASSLQSAYQITSTASVCLFRCFKYMAPQSTTNTTIKLRSAIHTPRFVETRTNISSIEDREAVKVLTEKQSPDRYR